MKLVIAGGRGFVGSHLVRYLADKVQDLVVLTRNPHKAPPPTGRSVRYVGWDVSAEGRWTETLRDADAVVNLAGDNIGKGLWTKAKKQRILESRLRTTSAIVDALRRLDAGPATLINASAVGYYGARGDQALDESAPPGDDFLAQVCVQWEQTALQAANGRRVVLMRSGIVLGKDGGMFPLMALPFRLFVGGRLGTGRQWMSWIHVVDLVRIVEFVLERPNLSGPVNATAPNPVTNAEFTRSLARHLRRPAFLHVPAFLIRLLLGEQSILLLSGQRVLPRRLQEAGFVFRFPQLDDALKDLL